MVGPENKRRSVNQVKMMPVAKCHVTPLPSPTLHLVLSRRLQPRDPVFSHPKITGVSTSARTSRRSGISLDRSSCKDRPFAAQPSQLTNTPGSKAGTQCATPPAQRLSARLVTKISRFLQNPGAQISCRNSRIRPNPGRVVFAAKRGDGPKPLRRRHTPRAIAILFRFLGRLAAWLGLFSVGRGPIHNAV